MVPSEKGRGARSANSCHDVTEKERRLRVAALVCIKKRERQASPLRVNRIPRQGVRDPLAWAQEGTSQGEGLVIVRPASWGRDKSSWSPWNGLVRGIQFRFRMGKLFLIIWRQTDCECAEGT